MFVVFRNYIKPHNDITPLLASTNVIIIELITCFCQFVKVADVAMRLMVIVVDFAVDVVSV